MLVYSPLSTTSRIVPMYISIIIIIIESIQCTEYEWHLNLFLTLKL